MTYTYFVQLVVPYILVAFALRQSHTLRQTALHFKHAQSLCHSLVSVEITCMSRFA